MSDHEEVSLKEYLQSQLAGLRNENVLAKTELERRLDELNILCSEVVRDRGVFTSRELHDRLQAELSSEMIELKAFKGQVAGWFGSLGIFFSVVQIGLSILFYFLFHNTR